MDQLIYVCVRVAIPFILDVRLVDVPAGVPQEEDRTGFLHLPYVVLALIFIARRIQRFLSLVDREVEFPVLTSYDWYISMPTSYQLWVWEREAHKPVAQVLVQYVCMYVWSSHIAEYGSTG